MHNTKIAEPLALKISFNSLLKDPMTFFVFAILMLLTA